LGGSSGTSTRARPGSVACTRGVTWAALVPRARELYELAHELAPRGAPLAWHELKPTLDPQHWTVGNIRKRLGKARSDPWKDVWTEQQTLRR
jgi:DNA primase